MFIVLLPKKIIDYFPNIEIIGVVIILLSGNAPRLTIKVLDLQMVLWLNYTVYQLPIEMIILLVVVILVFWANTNLLSVTITANKRTRTITRIKNSFFSLLDTRSFGRYN